MQRNQQDTDNWGSVSLSKTHLYKILTTWFRPWVRFRAKMAIIASPSVVSHMASLVVLSLVVPSLVVLNHSGEGEGIDSSFATRSINKVVFIMSTAISVWGGSPNHFFNQKKRMNSQKMLEKATYAAVVLLNTYSDEILEFGQWKVVDRMIQVRGGHAVSVIR